MRSPGLPRRKARPLCFERLEPRWAPSATPLGDLRLDDFSELRSPTTAAAMVEPHVLSGLTRVQADYGLTGAGQTVALIDTGIAYDHAALGGGLGAGFRVVGGYDFAEGDANPYDDGPAGSHGTHVAGIVGAGGSVAPGVAPGADLVALRVFDDNGRGQFAWVEQALRWVHEHRNDFAHPITTVNLSLGAPWNAQAIPGWATLEDEFAQLEADGVFIAVAAGNAFTTYQQPGLAYPAASSHVVPVGAVDGDGNLSYFSQRAARMIAAPGRAVLSSVPDYFGNENGRGDDYAQFSGTSMAAPYVAGASMLLREAYAFAGQSQVSQQTLYSVLYATADAVYDAATGQTYRRLNLARAVEAAMPGDDYGSTAAAAWSLGTLQDRNALSGAFAKRGDEDWFSLTAGQTGTLTLSMRAAETLRPQWRVEGLDLSTTAAGDRVLSFKVTAGQTYKFGVVGGAALGRYQLDLQLAAAPPAASLVRVLSDRVVVVGTAGDDRFEFSAAERRVSVNGVVYTIDAAAMRDITFDGGAGRDTAEVIGGGSSDTAVFRPEQVELSASAYRLRVSGVETVVIDTAGGNDRATFYDSPGDDLFRAAPAEAEQTGSGLTYRVRNCESLSANASAGLDRAELRDSAGSDTLVATPRYATLSGAGYSIRVVGFEQVAAQATTGADRAVFYDSAGDDLLVAGSRAVRLSGAGFDNFAAGFRNVTVYATAGGRDTAQVACEPGATWAAGRDSAELRRGDFVLRARYFESVQAVDEAVLTARLTSSALREPLPASLGRVPLLARPAV